MGKDTIKQLENLLLLPELLLPTPVGGKQIESSFTAPDIFLKAELDTWYRRRLASQQPVSPTRSATLLCHYILRENK